MARIDSTPRHLGDVLYSDPAVPRIPEQEWVDIVRAVSAGDRAAMRALYDRSHEPAFALILCIVGDRAAAEALTTDVFDDIWRQASSHDAAKETVLEWIMNRARAQALAFRRDDRLGKEAP